MITYPVSEPFIGIPEIDSVTAVMKSGFITQGIKVKEFEQRLAEELDIEHVVACSSGTTALHLALAALEFGPGHEVLVPNVTFIASANAVLYTGATPVFVDIDPVTWNIDLVDAAKKITKHTCAIMPVHLYGTPCNMVAIQDFAIANELYIIEDTAEGLGGSFHGAALGTHGDCGVFSFYANKIITTGEGGAVVTEDKDIANRLRLLRGQAMGRQRYWHEELGFNYRMTELQAAIGVEQINRLDTFVNARRNVFDWYEQDLRGVLTLPKVVEGIGAPWLFTGLLPEDVSRDAVMLSLEKYGVETRPIFPPLNQQPHLFDTGDFPVSDMISRRGISLPTYPRLTRADVSIVSLAVNSVLDGVRNEQSFRNTSGGVTQPVTRTRKARKR